MTKSTAIIVLHYGDINNTLRCLDSLDKLPDRDSFNVYIVDNGTKTVTTKHIKDFRFNKTLLLNKKNLGYAGGNNVGIKAALKNNYDFILILNNDTIVEPKIIQELKMPLRDSRYGIAGCIITYDDTKNHIWYAGGHLNPKLCITRHPHMNAVLSATKISSGPTDFISGAAIMIKRDVFNKIGLLPENYFLYWEDVDFCYTANKNHYSSYLVNKVLVRHSVSASSGERGSNALSPIRAYYYARNPFLFMTQNNLISLAAIIGQVFIRLPYSLLTVNSPMAAVEYLRGMRDGIRLLFNPNQVDVVR